MTLPVSAPFADAASTATPGAPIASLYDLSPLAVLAVDGPDAATFLQGQLSNDVRRLGPGRWQATTYSSPKGRVLANFALWPHGAGYRALVPAALAESLRKRLSMFVLRSKVTVSDLTSGVGRLGIAGRGAAARIATRLGAAPQPKEVASSAAGDVLGLAGERFVVLLSDPGAAESLAAGDPPAPFSAWEWLAIRAGEPLVTPTTQDQFVPQAANLDVLEAVSFDKGCYTGQEIVARTQYLGRLKERLFGYHEDGHGAQPGVRLYSPVFGDQACGTVVNAAPAPSGGTDLLAVVQTAAAAEVRLGSPDGPSLTPFALPYSLPTPTPPRRPG